MTSLEPSRENDRSRTLHEPSWGARQRTDSRPGSRSYRVTTLGSEVAARRLRTGEKATREPGRPCSRFVSVRINRRPGTSHKSTCPSLQPTARRLPSGEKLTLKPATGRWVSVARALLRVSCQR